MNIANLTKATAPVVAAAVMAASLNASAGENDGYIESEGDAYVSLGHCAGPNTKIEVDFQLTEFDLSAQPSPFGSWGDRLTIPMFCLYISHRGDYVPRFSWDGTDSDGNRQAYNCDTVYADGSETLNRHVVSFDSASRTYVSTDVTGEKAQFTYTFENPVSSYRSPYPLAVFGRGGDSAATLPGSFGRPTKMKVFGVKIWESGELVKTYTPCLKGGVPGLKVTGPGVDAFVTGVEPTKVKYGGDILVEKEDPCISTEINDVMSAAVAGERIYLDTGYYFKTISRAELDFAPLTPNTWTSSTPYNHAPEFMYARSYNPNYELDIVGRNTTSTGGNIGAKIGNSDYRNMLSLNYAYGIRRTVSIDSNSVSVATAGYTNYYNKITTAGYGILNDLTTTLKLASASTGNDFAPMKIYGLKLYESNNLVKDFRPIVTNGVPGLVDVLNPADVRISSTYGDSTGYRTNIVFEAYGGFDCTDGSDEAYLEFDGESGFVDTGVTVGSGSVIEADFSLWNTRNLNIANGQQRMLVQESSAGNIVAILYINSENNYSYQYSDSGSVEKPDNTRIRATNSRKRFRFDGPAEKFTITEGGSVLYDAAIPGTRDRTGGTETLKIGNAIACMRLYSFRVTTGGSVVRDYVPYLSNGEAGLYELCTKTFVPLAGAKVRGARTRNAEGVVTTFQEPPRNGKTTKKENDTPTLFCKASGAQWYEWYADGELVENETNDTLIVNWKKLKKPFTVEYSVVPVYSVFNETVKGDPAFATVTMPPKGTAMFFK